MFYNFKVFDIAEARFNLVTKEIQFRFLRKLKNFAELIKLSKFLKGLKKSVFFDTPVYAFTNNKTSERFCKHLGFERLTKEGDRVKWFYQY